MPITRTRSGAPTISNETGMERIVSRSAAGDAAGYSGSRPLLNTRATVNDSRSSSNATSAT
jgi:hypothetical protein